METLFKEILSRSPGWLQELRRRAWQAFEQMPMPQRYEEDWRRTDLRGLRLDDFAPAGEITSSAVPEWYTPSEDYAAHQLFDDATARSLAGDLPSGVIFTDLATAAERHPELVERYLFKQVPYRFNRLVALTAALWQGGTLLYVPRGVQLEKPLHIATWLHTPGQADLSHTLIVLEAGASASVLQVRGSQQPQSAGFHSGVTEIYVQDDASLQYADLQTWNRSTWDFSVQRAELGRDSRLRWFTGIVGSRLSKSYHEAYLRGEGADAQMYGLFLARGRQHLDIQTHQAHEAEHTTSNLFYRGVLTERGRSIWRGMIRVEPKGQRTDAYQTNRNLLLSHDARADSIPGLEIEADDVRCSHSAAASPVDPEQRFYLMSRGIPAPLARTMLVYGFVDDVLQHAIHPGIREQLEEAISQMLEA